MTADIPTTEKIFPMGSVPKITGVCHHYGNSITICDVGPGTEQGKAPEFKPEPAKLDDAGRIGMAAFNLRHSEAFRAAKENRPYDNVGWDKGADDGLLPPNPPEDIKQQLVKASGLAGAAPAAGATPTSQRLTGKVAVGVVIVSGPGNLAFSAAEITKVHAEVQHGLSWLGCQAGVAAPVQFFHDNQEVTLTLPDDPNGNDKEGYWRNPAMQKLGYPNVNAYAEHLRTTLNTDWTYVAFFMKYSQTHFAYAYMGGAYLCMQYANDGWGPDNIDRVFAHETGHIFNAPDEYSGANCNCTSTYGIYGVKNLNCETCAPGGSVDCIMKGNSWAMCAYTPWHLGYLDVSNVNIASVQFSNVYLRMDGNGVTSPTGPGGGTVNCQYTAGPWEKFNIHLNSDGVFSLESVQFPDVYLRMDGNGVTSPTGPGGGTVNCQYTAGPWEKYRLAPQSSGKVAIASVQFPNVYLRMDGSGVTSPTGPGGGTVNCQYGVGPWEQFVISPA